MYVTNVVRTEYYNGRWRNRWYTIVKLYGAERWNLEGLFQILRILNIESFILYDNRLEIPKYIRAELLEQMIEKYNAVIKPEIRRKKKAKVIKA